MKQETCCAKLGEPDERNGMEVCGKPVEYLDAGAKGNAFTGWYHESRMLVTDHYAVPASYVR